MMYERPMTSIHVGVKLGWGKTSGNLPEVLPISGIFVNI